MRTDRSRGALLLERLAPGTPLIVDDGEQATQAAAQLMQQLWRADPEGASYPTVEGWGKGFQRLGAAFPDAEGPILGRI